MSILDLSGSVPRPCLRGRAGAQTRGEAEPGHGEAGRERDQPPPVTVHHEVESADGDGHPREIAQRADDGRVRPGSGTTELFLLPGARFRAVDALLTNFHLPRSSLLLLVAAFAGRERVLAAYAEAIRRGYRFYSYGDAMLIR